MVEKEIETVIPREEGSGVCILKGEFKGEIGKMLAKDRKKEQVTVQIGMEIVTVSMDDCCQVAEL